MKRGKERIVIIGGGGHGKVVIDAIKRAGKYTIAGIVDPRLPKDSSVLDCPVVGRDENLPKIFNDGIKYAFIGVGSVGDCSLRRKICENLKRIGFDLPVVIHPAAVVAQDVLDHIGEGTFIAAGAVVNPGAKIGKNVIVNTRSSVDHDCTIGDFVHVAPGATLSGGIRVGNRTHIGTGANVIQDIIIGEDCLIAAGTTLRQNWESGKYTERTVGIYEKA